jgi:hypothetical protein
MVASANDAPIPTSQEFARVEGLCRTLAAKDFAYLSAERMRALLRELGRPTLPDWDVFEQSWNDLHVDSYMADGGRCLRAFIATASTTC